MKKIIIENMPNKDRERELESKVAMMSEKVSTAENVLKRVLEKQGWQVDQSVALDWQKRAEEHEDAHRKTRERLDRAMEDMEFYRKILREKGFGIK